MAAVGGGRGLVDQLYRAAEKAGVQVRYKAWVRDLIRTDAGVIGLGGLGMADSSSTSFEAASSWSTWRRCS